MNFDIFQWRSIKTRVTLFTLTVFLIGIWSLSLYASRMLRTDMQRILGEHQFSTVSFVAAAVNEELESRIKALEKVAEMITPAMFSNHGILQTALEYRPILPILFSGGTFITGLDGTTIADISPSTRRTGINYLDRDYLTTALKGESNISKPVISKALLSPVFVVAVPIKDSKSRVIGVLAGVVDLSKHTFLDKISENRYGNTGGYLLIAPQHKLFVTATDKSRIMKSLPAPGINLMHDRYMNGFDGFGLAMSSRGIEELTAAKHVPVVGWFVVAVLPAEEAFAPIRAMQQNMLFATIFLTILAGGLTWWMSLSMLRRNLSPILAAAQLLETHSETSQLPQPIPITNQNEIGQLIGAFNRLLDTVGQREESLRELNDKIHEQYEDLQMNEEELRTQNDNLLATEEMLRKQMEEYETSQKRLQKSEAKFVELLDNTKIQLWAFDGTSYTYANKEWFDFTGQKPDSPLTIKRWVSVVHPDDAEKSGEVWLKNWKTKTEHDNYFRLRRHDGVYRDFYCHAVPITDEHGVFHYFQGFNLDITERKQAEEKLNQANSDWESTFDSVPDMITIQDKDFNITRSNLAAKNALGISSLLPVKCYKSLHGTAQPLSGCPSCESITTGVSCTVELFEPHIGKYLEIRAIPRLGNDGSIISLIHVIRDITGSKQAEKERQQLEHQFHQSQKLESLGVLAGGIAHDFNNILTVITGHCYMARENMLPEQEYKAVFQKIETAGNRAADLCRQMLTYAGKSQMEKTQVNLWLLVDEVVKMLQAAIKKNVSIELDLNRVVPEIKGDTGQIQQIIMNLIINAAEAIGENSGTIHVALTRILVKSDQTETDTFGTVIQAGGYICLEVADNGCGMDEETQKRIFEPFFTTKFTGRGLGMSAIHGIIKSHDGALQLTSKPGVGTTFKVFFPTPKTTDKAEATLTPISLNKNTDGTILLVEDEETLRVMAEALLDAMGFSVTTASNGSEALEIYRERGSEIDVILMDLIMPVMGGIEAFHELRKISGTVPIIICSGYGVDSVGNVIGNDPHAGFVHKPYKPVELRDVVVRMMG